MFEVMNVLGNECRGDECRTISCFHRPPFLNGFTIFAPLEPRDCPRAISRASGSKIPEISRSFCNQLEVSSGPSGLLDNILHSLRALRPCDLRNSAMMGQCLREIQKNHREIQKRSQRNPKCSFCFIFLCSEISALGGFCDVQDVYEEELGILVVGLSLSFLNVVVCQSLKCNFYTKKILF